MIPNANQGLVSGRSRVPILLLPALAYGAARLIAAAVLGTRTDPLVPKGELKRHEKSAPKLVEWAETTLPEGFAVFAFPEAHRRRLRTSNLCERLNKELARRTRVVTLFPNEASCLRLASAVAMEISEDWVTDRVYLDVTE